MNSIVIGSPRINPLALGLFAIAATPSLVIGDYKPNSTSNPQLPPQQFDAKFPRQDAKRIAAAKAKRDRKAAKKIKEPK